MAAPTDPWRAFELDPRDPTHAHLRAADRDRDVVSGWLTTAYVEGRLDREELDERTDMLARSKTLRDLLPIVADLVPSRTPATLGTRVLAQAAPGDLLQMAVASYRSQLRARVMTLAGLSALLWAIWAVAAVAGGAGPPWPLIVMAALAFRLARTVAHRDDIVRRELRRLEKKQRRALKAPETPMGDD